jgi:hypothetical protein
MTHIMQCVRTHFGPELRNTPVTKALTIKTMLVQFSSKFGTEISLNNGSFLVLFLQILSLENRHGMERS